MRITYAHVAYWEQKQTAPKWVRDYRAKRGRIDRTDGVDCCVNEHAGLRLTDGELAAHNLLSLLRLYRKRDPSLLARLEGLANAPGTTVTPEKRAAFARKWANRIRRRQRERGGSHVGHR